MMRIKIYTVKTSQMKINMVKTRQMNCLSGMQKKPIANICVTFSILFQIMSSPMLIVYLLNVFMITGRKECP